LQKIYQKYRINRNPKHYDLGIAFFIKGFKVMGERMVEITGKKD
jgi:hypothetical protein